MSMFDGQISTEEELKQVLELMTALFVETVKVPLDRELSGVLELMMKGLSLGDILGVTEEGRKAVLAQCVQMIRSGDVMRARQVLVLLYQLEPLDTKVLYALGTTYQLSEQHDMAAKIYIQFLALDATNPEGYLRLGECLMKTGEYAESKSSFEVAIVHCKAGHGKQRQIDYARRMLARLDLIPAARPH